MDDAERTAVMVEMVEELHVALFGETWTEPVMPREHWARLLEIVAGQVLLVEAVELAILRYQTGAQSGGAAPL